ncbi:MAG: osmotically inducible lipoprotein OsmB [Pseudomonadota bacterium]|nr:osmotically inducible lipoprotein OsmB [Pseudomonadota bacterium]
MKTIQRVSITLAVLIGLGGCSGMSQQDQNTVVGAGIGGVAGAVLTDGSPVGAVGGAVVGGIIGNQIDTNDDQNRHRGRH